MIFMHRLAELDIHDSFFKRVFLLTKIWMNNEAMILASHSGMLSSYALEVMLLNMFNKVGDNYETPVEAFFDFFRVLNEIEMDSEIIGFHGIYNIDDYYNSMVDPQFDLDVINNDEKDGRTYSIGYVQMQALRSFVEKFKTLDKVQNFNLANQVVTLKNLNILDPLFNGNNLGKSVNYFSFSRFKMLVKYVLKMVGELEEMEEDEEVDSLIYLSKLAKFFENTISQNSSEALLALMNKPSFVLFDDDEEENKEIEFDFCNFEKVYGKTNGKIPGNITLEILQNFEEQKQAKVNLKSFYDISYIENFMLKAKFK